MARPLCQALSGVQAVVQGTMVPASIGSTGLQSTQIGKAIFNVFCGALIRRISYVVFHEVLKVQNAK